MKDLNEILKDADETFTVLLLASMILEELPEEEQNAFMCASLDMLADQRDISPYQLIYQYMKAIKEVHSSENKGQ